MKPKILICYLEKDKFKEAFYCKQMEALKELSSFFETTLYLRQDNAEQLFLGMDVREAICLTTSSEVAEQMQGLGIAVLGFQTSSDEWMKVRQVTTDLAGMEYKDFVRTYQRYHGIPWEITCTNRLQIREFGMPDMEALQMLYAKFQSNLFVEPLFAEEQERQYQEGYIRQIYGFYGYGMWLLFHKKTGELIGRAGIESRETCGAAEVEMGYLIAPEYQRQGYAKEACQAIMKYAKEELCMKRVLCRVSSNNHASLNLLKQLGFSLEKRGEEMLFSYEL